jgi:hypothetical protein
VIFDYWKKVGCWMVDTRYWILDTGYWMLDAGYWMLDTGTCFFLHTFAGLFAFYQGLCCKIKLMIVIAFTNGNHCQTKIE